MVKKLEGYEKPATVNPYIAELSGLALGDAFDEVIVPTGTRDDGTPKGIEGKRAQIQDAARSLGFSARIQEREDREDGSVRFVFKLFPAQERNTDKA